MIEKCSRFATLNNLLDILEYLEYLKRDGTGYRLRWAGRHQFDIYGYIKGYNQDTRTIYVRLGGERDAFFGFTAKRENIERWVERLPENDKWLLPGEGRYTRSLDMFLEYYEKERGLLPIPADRAEEFYPALLAIDLCLANEYNIDTDSLLKDFLALLRKKEIREGRYFCPDSVNTFLKDNGVDTENPIVISNPERWYRFVMFTKFQYLIGNKEIIKQVLSSYIPVPLEILEFDSQELLYSEGFRRYRLGDPDLRLSYTTCLSPTFKSSPNYIRIETYPLDEGMFNALRYWLSTEMRFDHYRDIGDRIIFRPPDNNTMIVYDEVLPPDSLIHYLLSRLLPMHVRYSFVLNFKHKDIPISNKIGESVLGSIVV